MITSSLSTYCRMLLLTSVEPTASVTELQGGSKDETQCIEAGVHSRISDFPGPLGTTPFSTGYLLSCAYMFLECSSSYKPEKAAFSLVIYTRSEQEIGKLRVGRKLFRTTRYGWDWCGSDKGKERDRSGRE